MSGEHFPAGKFPHEPQLFLPEAVYESVEKNVVTACTDVALRDPETGKLFLGMRQAEPQIGPWFIGGRNAYGLSIQENAAKQVENDLGLEIDEYRFAHIGTYSTPFPIAGPGREEHGRHTMNAVMIADLAPEEVAEINRRIEDGEFNKKEYGGGGWYDPEEMTDPGTPYPYVVKQFARDLNRHDRMYEVDWVDAHKEYDVRKREQKHHEKTMDALDQDARAIAIMMDDPSYMLTHEQAEQLSRTAENMTFSSIELARAALPVMPREELEGLLADEELGDAQIKRILRERVFETEHAYDEIFMYVEDNGPSMRKLLQGAVKYLKFTEENSEDR